MRAVVITRHGGPEVLQVQDRPEPAAPKDGEVAVDVRAAGVNFADTMARVGFYPDAPKPPMVVGYEVAGVVTAVGPDVDTVAVGDRVLA
ncbi:alcohol dehydrogenase catalytic domain-containing protein, partial [Nocardioides pelophilus]|uniref:alcohol dehydrogenase catalytic domain-containing protein n=1 Tax=Nocardioides pelophilus TaxID=2172019 RepID=UPI00160142A1